MAKTVRKPVSKKSSPFPEKKSGKGKGKKLLSKLLLWSKRIFVFFILSTVFVTFLYRYINPFITPLMVIRSGEQILQGDQVKLKYKWVDMKDMSPFVPKTALAAEDQKFFEHDGFDFDAIMTAFKKNQYSKKIRGGSTISQQTAKNVFLWPGRSWLRKGLEAYFTVLIEFMWTKERILEVYLNVIEMGKGVYGTEAAARYYYNKKSKNLTKAEAAAIASVFPLPLKWNPLKPGNQLMKKQAWIRKQADFVVFELK